MIITAILEKHVFNVNKIATWLIATWLVATIPMQLSRMQVQYKIHKTISLSRIYYVYNLFRG